MIVWLWKRIEPYVQATITDRILKYNQFLIEREDIRPPDTEGPKSHHPLGASLHPCGMKALVKRASKSASSA